MKKERVLFRFKVTCRHKYLRFPSKLIESISTFERNQILKHIKSAIHYLAPIPFKETRGNWKVIWRHALKNWRENVAENDYLPLFPPDCQKKCLIIAISWFFVFASLISFLVFCNNVVWWCQSEWRRRRNMWIQEIIVVICARDHPYIKQLCRQLIKLTSYF